jgi:hypothetical protein
MEKSYAKAYFRKLSAAFMLPASLLINAAIIWASTQEESFSSTSEISFKAPGVSFNNHLAFAS